MLYFLSLSRSGYRMFLHRRLAATWQQKEARKAQIQHVYENSHQLYGAPKITHILQQQGIRIAERTVGVYMKELGIRARWVKPWIATTCHSDFSTQLRNLNGSSLRLSIPIPCGVQTLPISGHSRALCT